MLVNWYFCCCIGTSAHRTQVFLAILDSLDSNGHAGVLTHYAYRELRNTDSWMQIYALPWVLASLQGTDRDDSPHAAVRDYLHDLVQMVPGKSSLAFRALTEAVMAGSDSAELVLLIERCARSLDLEDERDPADVPYLDLRDFLAETFLLATIAAQLRADAGFVAQLQPALFDAEDETLSMLLDTALDGQFGRLAFLLSMRIAHFFVDHAPFSKRRLQQRIWNHPAHNPELEPDLLALSAEIAFTNPLVADGAAVCQHEIARLLDESVRFRELHRLRRSMSQQRSEQREARNRIGMRIAYEEQDEALVITYWQVTIWDLIQRRSPDDVPKTLQDIWQPRQVSRLPHLILPASGAEFEQLRPYVTTLLQYFRHLRNVELRPGNPNRNLPPHLLWTFGSPWLDFALPFIKDPTARCRYQKTQDIVVLIRLIACTCIAMRYLQSLANDDAALPARNCFATLIVHAADVLFRGDINRHKLPEQVRGLFSFGCRQVRSAGRGALPAISPSDFLAIIGVSEKPAEEQPADDNGAEPGHQSDHKSWRGKQIFYERVLPLTLFEWLSDDEDEYGVANLAQWYDQLPQISAKWRQGLDSYRPREPERWRPLLIMRFLRPDKYEDANERGWWEPEHNHNGRPDDRSGRWDAQGMPQRMLLSAPLPADLWLQPTWPEPNWEHNSTLTVRLVRALQRYVRFDCEPGQVDAAQGAKWRADLDRCLNDIQHRRQLDRFVRLLMLEVLEQVQAHQDDLAVRKLIVQVLFEYGTLDDLERLCAIVFARNEHGALQVVDSTRQVLRNELLRMLFRSTRPALRTQRRDVNPRDPLAARSAGARRRFIETQLIQIAFLAGLPTANEADITLRRKLRDMREQSWQPGTRDPVAVIESEIAYTWDRQQGNLATVIRTPPTQSVPLSWMIHGVILDRNGLQATVFADEFLVDHLTNLFDMPKKERRQFLGDKSGQTHLVLALVIEMHPQEKKSGWMLLELDFGVSSCLLGEWPSRDLQGIQPGKYVELPIKYDQQQHRWMVDYRKPIEPLRRSLQARDVVSAGLRERWNHNKKQWQLQMIPGGDPDDEAEIPSLSPENRFFWDADVSRRFHKSPDTNQQQLYEWSVLAHTDPQYGFAPITWTLADLLLTVPPGEPAVFVLTLISPLVLPTGEQVWCFAQQPGENYIIYQHQFQPASFERLLDQVGEGSRSHGLLVTLQAKLADDIVQLTLAEQRPATHSYDASFPDLRVPFDRRNLEWQALFDTDEQLIAWRSGHEWRYDVPAGYAPGYPRTITVEWAKQPASSRRAEFTVNAWGDNEQREGRVNAVPVDRKRLRLPEHDRDLFLQRWKDIKRGAIVQINNPFRALSQQSPSVQCFTRDSMLINVDFASLTMAPRPLHTLTTSELAPLVRDRLVRLDDGEWELAGTPYIGDCDAIPAQVWRNRCCEGLLIEVPELDTDDESAGSNYCTVLWETDAQPIPSTIQITNAAELRLQLGSWLSGWLDGDEPRFTLKTLRRVRGHALWSLDEQQAQDDDLRYLGEIITLGPLPLAEAAPGRLVRLRERRPDLRHLATGDGKQFEGGLPADRRYRNNAPTDRQWTFHQIRYRHAMLTYDHGNQLYQILGTCRADTGNHNLLIRDVRITASQIHVDGTPYFALRRHFTLETASAASPNTRAVADDWRARFDRYMADPDRDPLRAQFDERTHTFWLTGFSVPSSQKNGVSANRVSQQDPTAQKDKPTNCVHLLPGDGPYILDSVYPRDALVWLEWVDDVVYGSLRAVPAASPERFRAELDAEFGTLYPLTDRLYYAGAETRADDGGETQWFHRFEWGYGKTLYVPEDQLRFNGEPFNHATLLLTYGDIVTSVTFYPAEEPAGASDDRQPVDEKVIIAISDAHLELSMARSLYVQRSIYRMIHVAHLRVDGDELAIHTIDGVNEKRGTDLTASYTVRHARLAPASQERLQARLAAGWDETSGDRIVLIRLDLYEFERTLGQHVVFHHVRFSLQPESSREPDAVDQLPNQDARDESYPEMESGELVITRAGKIAPRTNDMLLHLEPLNGLHPADIGQDMRGIGVLRRQFSMREDLLRRIYNFESYNETQSELRDRQLLTRIIQRNDSQPSASMLHNIPPRKRRALTTAISAAGGSLIVVVVQYKDACAHFELLPGVFVELERQWIEGDERILTPGAYVQISQREPGQDKPFQIIRAAFGDRRYVTDRPRSVVALPKNTLLKDERRIQNQNSLAFWSSRRDFTVGSLPDIDATPGMFNEKTREWQPPQPACFIQLMETEHPKFARVGLDKNNQVRIGPCGRETIAGALDIAADRLTVQLKPLNDAAQHFAQQPLEWRLLSYADRSATSLSNHVKRISWSYHDTQTGTWTADGVSRTHMPQKNSPLSGPVFFEETAAGLRLRYCRENLLQFGYAASELERSIESNRGRSLVCVVVGPSDADGLWVELGPGRIAEIPAQMIELDVRFGRTTSPRSSTRRNRSLADMHWAAFASGDMIRLGLSTESALEISRFSLQDWQPGPRAALGPGHCLLPVAHYDPDTGALRLGAGDYQLTLPVTTFDTTITMVLLTPENDLTDARNIRLQRDDVVLIVRDENDRLSVSGHPNYALYADRVAENWANDPFAPLITRVEEQRGYRRFLEANLASLVRLNGGALPMTVEGVTGDSIYLSRRHQVAAGMLPPGRRIVGRVLGLLNDRDVVLRCGSGLFLAPLNSLIVGLPARFNNGAVAVLREREIAIWWRQTHEGSLEFGFSASSIEVRGAGQVEALGLVSIDEPSPAKVHAGLICRTVESQRLYWLPETHLAWAQLSLVQLREQFLDAGGSGRLLPVSALPKRSWVSLIDRPQQQKEFRDMVIGKELLIRIVGPYEGYSVAPTDTRRSYLAESSTTGVLLECAVFDGTELDVNQQLTAEVIRRVDDSPRRIVVTPLPQNKPYHLDLPTWMLNQAGQSAPLRAELMDYRRWIRSEPVPWPPPETFVAEQSSHNELEQWLCYAYLSDNQSEDAVAHKAHIAEQWYNQIKHAPEVFAAYPLMAALILYEAGNAEGHPRDQQAGWNTTAGEIIWEARRRALRSMHVDVMANRWLSNISAAGADGAWVRLRAIHRQFSDPAKREQVATLRRFYRSVELREQDTLIPIAHAIAAAIGDLTELSPLQQRADWTARLIAIIGSLPQQEHNRVWLFPTAVDKLRDLLDEINISGVDVTLLDPLPPLRRGLPEVVGEDDA